MNETDPATHTNILSLGSTERATTHSLGAVANDWEAIDVWLRTVTQNNAKGSNQTEATYRHHLAKVRWYSEVVCRRPPSRWSMQDVQDLKDFIRVLPSFAITSRSTLDRSCRPGPFRKQPSPSSQTDLMRFVSAMFSALNRTGYIPLDPTALIRTSRVQRLDRTRTVDLDIFAEVLRGMDQYAALDTTVVGKMLHRRDRFALVALRELGLRASEMVGAKMNAVFCLTDPKTGKEYWAFKVERDTAKGGVERTVPFSVRVMDEMIGYRIAFGLNPLPEPGDTRPLLLSPKTKQEVRGARSITSKQDLRFFGQWGSVETRSGLYKIVKGRLADAARALELRGEIEAADRLRRASPHWLRHTFATAALSLGHDLKQVAGVLGHSSIRTTMAYTEQEALDQVRMWSMFAPAAVAGQ